MARLPIVDVRHDVTVETTPPPPPPPLHTHTHTHTLIIAYHCHILYYVDEKAPTGALFNNSEKRVQILLELSQQIVQ